MPVHQPTPSFWSNTAPAVDGKLAVNFEGRVTAVGDGRVELDDGRAVLIGEHTAVLSPDGSAAQIAVGDYLQGCAENPDGSELNAQSILITVL